MFTRRSLFKRLAVAALAVPFVAESIASAAPIPEPQSVEGLAPAPTTVQPVESVARADPLGDGWAPKPRPADTPDQLMQRMFSCPFGCELSVHYDVLRLGYKLTVWAPGADHWRLAMLVEDAARADVRREALVMLIQEDARMHRNQEWARQAARYNPPAPTHTDVARIIEDLAMHPEPITAKPNRLTYDTLMRAWDALDTVPGIGIHGARPG